MDSRLTGRIVIALMILSLFVGFAILAKPGLAAPARKPDASGVFKPASASYPPDTIAVLEIFSAISFDESSDPFGLKSEGTLEYISRLESVEDNPNVKAVLLRINSPGGTIAATQELYGAIQRLKKKGKKVTVSMEDIAASGAYYISCAADRVIANPGTLVGSIGVIIAGLDMTGLMQKIGLGYNVIKSGKNKDIMSGYRKQTDEERQLLQEVVMDSFGQFFDVVTNGRPISSRELQPIADGRIFTGNQALKLKLVDELGDFQHAVDSTAALAGIHGKPNVVRIQSRKFSILQYLTASLSPMSRGKIEISTSVDRQIPRFSSPVLYFYAN